MISAWGQALERQLDRLPDTCSFFDHYFTARRVQFVTLLAIGLALRAGTFGNPNLHIDETFYFLVGQRMHDGLLPYVDIWDRKPLGLFLIYYVIAGISREVIAYQIVAWLFASSTAMVINRIAQRWAGVQGGVLAGVAYLVMLGPLQGFGGQSPVFYNLFIAGTALLLCNDWQRLELGRPGWRSFAAMALAGSALTIKQTTVFEAVFFGLCIVYAMWRARAGFGRIVGTVAICALLGAIPTIAFGLYYFWAGYWEIYWQAMVLSNLEKTPGSMVGASLRLLITLYKMYVILAVALFSLLVMNAQQHLRPYRKLIIIWMFAALAGVAIIPNFYFFYALPLLVPLAVAAAFTLGRRAVGVLLIGLLTLVSSHGYSPLNWEHARQSKAALDRMAKAIEAHDEGGKLLVFDGPPYLYALTGKPTISPLTFPHHLHRRSERNVSHLNTSSELKRILLTKPRVVVLRTSKAVAPDNEDLRRLVLSYVKRNCSLVHVEILYGPDRVDPIAVYGDCAVKGSGG